MNRAQLNTSAARVVLIAGLAAISLVGCGKGDQATSSAAPAPLAALPMADSGAAPIVSAPTISALPPAPRVRVSRLANRGDYYAYADQAYASNDAFGDAPPDYTFDYDGTRPWVWRGDDQSTRVVEPLPGGGDRYYYYQPGSDYPYLVRDPEYSYGYDSGTFVVVYDRQGRALSADQQQAQIDAASRVLARARSLYAATQQQQHQAVYQANWAARRSAISAEQARWAAEQAQQSDWRAYHDAHQQQEQAQWTGERFRREAQAARFDQANNDPQAARRDWQAAHQAHVQAPPQQQQPQPQQPPPPHMFGGGQPQPPAPPAPVAAPNPPHDHGPGGAPGGFDHRPPASPPAPVAGPPVQPHAPPPGAQQPNSGRHDHEHGPLAPTFGAHPAAPPEARREPPAAVVQPPRPPVQSPFAHAAGILVRPNQPPVRVEPPRNEAPRVEAAHVPPPASHVDAPKPQVHVEAPHVDAPKPPPAAHAPSPFAKFGGQKLIAPEKKPEPNQP